MFHVLLRRLAAPVLATSLLLTVALPAFAYNIGISPVDGNQMDTFTVSGSGLTPGLALDINFTSPAGTQFSTANLNQVVVVDPDGNFSFDFVPANEFTGESAGLWGGSVCTAGTTDCSSGTFNISV